MARSGTVCSVEVWSGDDWRVGVRQARHGASWTGEFWKGQARMGQAGTSFWRAHVVVANGKATDQGVLAIPPLVTNTVVLRIVGDSELITHNWSEKAKKEMRDKQMKKAVGQKEAKDPEADYEGAFYRLPNGAPAVRTIAFKASAVDAATQLKAMTKVYLRGAFHVLGELVEIQGEPYMREDMVRVGMGTADLRYRPGFPVWSVDLPIRFNPNAITLEQLVHLFNQAGFSCGVGEWRPQKDGPFGMFHVEGVTEV